MNCGVWLSACYAVESYRDDGGGSGGVVGAVAEGDSVMRVPDCDEHAEAVGCISMAGCGCLMFALCLFFFFAAGFGVACMWR